MGGGVQKEVVSEGVGIASRVFPGAPSKIYEQAISYFTVNRFFKAKTIVFIDDLLFAVDFMLFSSLHDSLCNTIVVSS